MKLDRECIPAGIDSHSGRGECLKRLHRPMEDLSLPSIKDHRDSRLRRSTLFQSEAWAGQISTKAREGGQRR